MLGYPLLNKIMQLRLQIKKKQQYEQVIVSKDETIASLKGTIETFKQAYDDVQNQLAVKDNQITALTQLTNNAQTLNMVDKDPNRLKAPNSDAESDNESPSSTSNVDNRSKKKHWWPFSK